MLCPGPLACSPRPSLPPARSPVPAACPPAAPALQGSSDGTQSLAVFEGAERVHGAFDLLLNECMRGPGDEGEPPALLAPAPFLHGALRVAQAAVRWRGGGALGSAGVVVLLWLGDEQGSAGSS